MSRYLWSSLNTQQVGAYFEYFMKMEFTMYGFEVYTSEVDDRGVDFVARRDKGTFIEVQAKSLRDFGYVFMRKTHFTPSSSLYVALGLLKDHNEPQAFLVPSLVWKTPDALFVDRNYDGPGQTSAPEWGINFSRKSLAVLRQYSLNTMLVRLAGGA